MSLTRGLFGGVSPLSSQEFDRKCILIVTICVGFSPVQQNGGHTFLECISYGVVDPVKYMQYRQKEFERLDAIRKRGWGGEYTEVNSMLFPSCLCALLIFRLTACFGPSLS